MTEKRLNGSELLTVCEIIERRLKLFGVENASSLSNQMYKKFEKYVSLSKILEDGFTLRDSIGAVLQSYFEVFCEKFICERFYKDSNPPSYAFMRRTTIRKSIKELNVIIDSIENEINKKTFVDKDRVIQKISDIVEKELEINDDYFNIFEVKSLQVKGYEKLGLYTVAKFVNKESSKVWGDIFDLDVDEENATITYKRGKQNELNSYSSFITMKELWIGEDVFDILKEYDVISPNYDYKALLKRFVVSGEIDMVKALLSFKGNVCYEPLRKLTETALNEILFNKCMKEIFIMSKTLTTKRGLKKESLGYTEEIIYNENEEVTKRYIIGVSKK